MNPLFTFVLGLLVGWLIEWLIDFFYWRTRQAEIEAVETYNYDSASSVRSSSAAEMESPRAAKVTPDDLKVIKGIGTVIERKLNDAGIYTFEQLGNLTVADLRSILGNVIERLSNEESLLQQARDLARRK
jgi:predicted flap endonuclease-1-like 5' DNA nuclease